MGHGPTIAWKASPTRTPPPICTSAPFPKPRWSKDRGRREPLRNTQCEISRNQFDHRSRPSLSRCCSAAVADCESKFLNHREESRVSQILPQSQKFFIKYLRLLGERPIFEMLRVAMWISD